MSLTRREFLKALGAAAITAALPHGSSSLGLAGNGPFIISFPVQGLEAVPHTFSMMLRSTKGPWPGQWVRVAKVFTPKAGAIMVSIDLEDLDDCTWTLMGGGAASHIEECRTNLLLQSEGRSADVAMAQLERGAAPRPFIKAAG